VKYNNDFFFFIPFLRNSPTGQTDRQIFALDGSNNADSRKGVHFGVFVNIVPLFGVIN